MNNDEADAERTHIWQPSIATGWKIYRVTTRSSHYTVGLNLGGAKKFAVLRGRGSSGDAIDVRDSDPELDGQSLFALSPDKWVGGHLQLGMVSTSRVTEVHEETDPEVIGSVTSLARRAHPLPGRIVRPERRDPPPKPDRSPYPVDWLESIESTGEILSRVNRNGRLLDDLGQRPEWQRRLKLALANCVSMAETIADKIK